MPKPLVIVESPAKAKTIAGFLGSDFVVESSIGHIRDLPRSAADVPPAYKGEPWARLGVDVDNDFKPLYVVAKEKKSQVSRLKSLVREASELYLATDEDREGESIAWHLLEVLAPRVPVKRMVFHEITRPAIARAVDDYRQLDRRLVDAQEARRILDRLYGYEVSPVLWKKIMPKLSAGRVQSVATRILVERERARMRFRSAAWWDVAGTFRAEGGSFDATLVALDGRRLATGRDFSETGQAAAGALLLDEPGARGLVARLEGAGFAVASVEEKPYRRQPYPPFMTSTLQQEAARKLRFGSQRTMQVAQRLYESGWITYMRTDSTALSETALDAARAQARALYGDAYVPERPRRYERKVKNAQEAHEAIRPAGETWSTPEQAAALGTDERRLYELVWKRTIASQMADARGTSAQVRLVGTMATPGPAISEMPAGAPTPGAPLPGGDRTWATAATAELAASGKVITFPGFLRAYVEGADDPEAELEDREAHLPPLSEGEALAPERLEAQGHATQPPARYTEASLVKALEDLGVGRPSTYASIIATIQDRGYVWKRGSALVPSFTAFAVVGLLEQHFADLVDYGFTAAMEDDLDEIAGGGEEAVPWLSRFYFGNGHPGLRSMVVDNLGGIDAREVNSIPIGADAEGRSMVVRVGRYGPYVQRGEQRASIPDDLAPDELTPQRVEALLAAPTEDRVLGEDPESGLPVLVRAGRFGPYVQLGQGAEGSPANGTGGAGGDGDAGSEGAAGAGTGRSGGAGAGVGGAAAGGGAKPRTASLLKSMSPETLSLEDALRLLRLPRVVGVDPADGEEVVALNGRYGPYLKKGGDSRSLTDEGQLFSVTLTEALALFAQPKAGPGRRAAAPPLRELGPDPVSGGTMVLREGRFGPYVTDGELNASLRRGDDVATLTPERAAELLADKRAGAGAVGAGSARGRGGGGRAKKAGGSTLGSANKSPSASKASGSAKKAGGSTPGSAKKSPGSANKSPSASRASGSAKKAPSGSRPA